MYFIFNLDNHTIEQFSDRDIVQRNVTKLFSQFQSLHIAFFNKIYIPHSNLYYEHVHILKVVILTVSFVWLIFFNINVTNVYIDIMQHL